MPKEVVQHPASDGFAEYSGTGNALTCSVIPFVCHRRTPTP